MLESAPANRILHLSGTPYQAGWQAGQALGERLEANIARYLSERPSEPDAMDMARLRAGALPWLRRLPERFQSELEGMADGAGLPLQRLGEWVYLEALLAGGCSGYFFREGPHLWVARNNDTFVPEMWGYVTRREIDGCIPTLSFGMEGDVFTPTGVNRERLWLHHQYLPLEEPAPPGSLPGYIWLPMALESCASLGEVEAFLATHPRSEGMLLFAGDGKRGEYAIYECAARGFQRRLPQGGWLVGTNHAYASAILPPPDPDSLARQSALEDGLACLKRLPERHDPQDYIALLADETVERRGKHFATACANVACLTTGELWYTFGGFPAASRGNWARLTWPW